MSVTLHAVPARVCAGVNEVGIERGDGPVVEALIQAELTVLVIPPSSGIERVPASSEDPQPAVVGW